MGFEGGLQSLGLTGFDRIEAADGPVTDGGPWHAIKAIGGDAAFAAGTTTDPGDDPAAGDVIQQGDVISGRFTAIELSGGTVYAYRIGKPS